jgi:CHAD domain.
MSYQLQRNETPGEGVRRICRRQVELGLAIVAGKKETVDTPVHETRKHLKKARAALRLVRREIGRGLFKRQDHCLRDVGRMISEIRDAEVRLETVRQLQKVTGRGGNVIRMWKRFWRMSWRISSRPSPNGSPKQFLFWSACAMTSTPGRSINSISSRSDEAFKGHTNADAMR